MAFDEVMRILVYEAWRTPHFKIEPRAVFKVISPATYFPAFGRRQPDGSISERDEQVAHARAAARTQNGGAEEGGL